MFTASKTPPSQKRATDIANVMDMADDPSAVYTDTENRMQQRQQDIDAAWAADPAWEDAPDSVKTAMTLAADAAGGTANTGDLLSKAQAVQAEQNPDDKIRKQKSLADSVATLVGKKPASDDQSINFAALANNIANDRYSGDAHGKDWTRKNAARFTGDNSAHTRSRPEIGKVSTPPRAGNNTDRTLFSVIGQAYDASMKKQNLDQDPLGFDDPHLAKIPLVGQTMRSVDAALRLANAVPDMIVQTGEHLGGSDGKRLARDLVSMPGAFAGSALPKLTQSVKTAEVAPDLAKKAMSDTKALAQDGITKLDDAIDHSPHARKHIAELRDMLDNPNPETVDFGKLGKSMVRKINKVRAAENQPLLDSGNIAIFENVIKKWQSNRMDQDGMTADSLARLAYRLLYKPGTRVEPGKYPTAAIMERKVGNRHDFGAIGRAQDGRASLKTAHKTNDKDMHGKRHSINKRSDR